MKKFSEMLDLINTRGLKALSEMIKEEPDNEQFTKELKDQQAKMDGKKKGGDVAKPAVQAVQNEETHTTVQVIDFDPVNGVQQSEIDLSDIQERTLTEPETKKKEEIILPQQKEIDLAKPELKNKGIKKNITNKYEENT